ncbi:hypothetical protein [uncultured Nostoc sp.]|uniref:hypothetical protein n=1 Tax=uncultured Nostoc sp. TaxID=340711 RepID=UPI0035C961D5
MAYSTGSRSEEILRIFAVIMFGGLLMVVQRWWFSAGVIDLNVSDDELWVMEHFTPVAIIVFIDSVFWAGMWYLTALGSNNNYVPEKHYKQILIRWGGFFLATLAITVGVALYFYRDASSTALPLFVGFFIINTMLIYWVSTAISTPGLLAYVVPGSVLLRKLFRIDN